MPGVYTTSVVGSDTLCGALVSGRCNVIHRPEEPTPMTNLSEDPTYLAGGLLLLAGVFLVALNITQQGKYLVRAGIMLGLAFVVVAVEWFWVTDNERIEQVVYALRQAVLHSDADGCT